MTGVKRLLVASLTLGFIGGYVDTVGFVALFGLFTAHVTGNFVLIGAELSRASGGRRSGCRLGSGSFNTNRSGGLGVSRAATQSR